MASSACSLPLQTSSETPGSIWHRQIGEFPSCAPDASGSDTVIGYGCQSDPTGLSVDMRRAAPDQKARCFAFKSDCDFNINDVSKIEFDLDAKDCKDVWNAPLWMTPPRWGPTQWQSGEIDLYEVCHQNENISFGNRENDYQPWGVDGTNASGKMRLMFDQQKDVIKMEFCDKQGANCRSLKDYTDYFKNFRTGYNASGSGMKLISDIWNGTGGDEGFSGRPAPSTTT